MREYVTEAVILDREPQKEQDSRIRFFSERFGKLTARASSARKITSKLSAHLEPGMLVRLRFVEKSGPLIVDSLKIGTIGALLPDIFALAKMLPEGQPEEGLWTALTRKDFRWSEVLKVLGWDPEASECVNCEQMTAAFYPGTQQFFCKPCASKLGTHEVIYM